MASTGSPVSEKNSSRKLAEQARCATLHSATGCGQAHRCDESRSLLANYKGMRCHVPQTLPLGRSHNRDEAHQVTESPSTTRSTVLSAAVPSPGTSPLSSRITFIPNN